MGSTNKRKGDRHAANPAGPPRQEVDRLIAKGWLKDAVKAAKICQRDDPSPEHHRLLERATLLRAEELQRGGMATAAREVATHLLDLPLTDPELTEPAIALLIAVGMAGEALKLQGRLESPEAVDRLTRQTADQAVLHPERMSGVPPEVMAVAKQVRSVLEALTTGAEGQALDALRDVARSSPFADWRLFARGLAASRRGDDAEAQANWSRLDPTRAAARIVRNLNAVTDPAPTDAPASLARREKLERWAFGEPLIAPLQAAAAAAAQGRWDDVIGKMGLIRLALRRFDPVLAVRLTQAVLSPLTREAMDLGYRDGRSLIQRFTRAAEPLPIDPHWYRLWALVWEGPQGDIAEADPFWHKYHASVDQIPAIRPEDRDAVRALVMTHLGIGYAEMAVAEEEADDDDGQSEIQWVNPDAARDRQRATTLLEGSLQLLPTHRATYQALMDLHGDAGQPDQVVAVARRLLSVLPDDFDALNLLARHHFDRDEPDAALDFARRARKLKPLDRAAIMQEWACLVAQARQHALARRWDEGRASLAAATRLDPDQSGKPHFIARQVALEIKAGRADLAEPLLAAALDRLPEAASLRLALAIEARRFKLPKKEVDRAEAQWAAEWTKKVRGDAAGGMAGVLGPFLAGGIKYTGRREHVRQVTDYLRKTTRIKFERDDLVQVCGFLSEIDKERELHEKLVKRGVKLFPVAFEFPMMLGMIELEKGPLLARTWQAKSHLESSLKLAKAQEQTDPKAAEAIPRIQEALSGLDEFARGPMGFPFSFPGRPGGGKATPAELFKAMANMMDDELGDDEFDDGGEFGPPPTPRRKGKR